MCKFTLLPSQNTQCEHDIEVLRRLVNFKVLLGSLLVACCYPYHYRPQTPEVMDAVKGACPVCAHVALQAEVDIVCLGQASSSVHTAPADLPASPDTDSPHVVPAAMEPHAPPPCA